MFSSKRANPDSNLSFVNNVRTFDAGYCFALKGLCAKKKKIKPEPKKTSTLGVVLCSRRGDKYDKFFFSCLCLASSRDRASHSLISRLAPARRSWLEMSLDNLVTRLETPCQPIANRFGPLRSYWPFALRALHSLSSSSLRHFVEGLFPSNVVH